MNGKLTAERYLLIGSFRKDTFGKHLRKGRPNNHLCFAKWVQKNKFGGMQSATRQHKPFFKFGGESMLDKREKGSLVPAIEFIANDRITKRK